MPKRSAQEKLDKYRYKIRKLEEKVKEKNWSRIRPLESSEDENIAGHTINLCIASPPANTRALISDVIRSWARTTGLITVRNPVTPIVACPEFASSSPRIQTLPGSATHNPKKSKPTIVINPYFPVDVVQKGFLIYYFLNTTTAITIARRGDCALPFGEAFSPA
ncbi:jg26984 [Pararge aegeria aegeria]|uniref:Jg26984 protein n=1 Tax=Pararge aegeria aegeria TaxID=348720 RepID=A0A8S4RVG7_9NEOP|nr:jg26984 [Pararge aegeria aegeria]